ncbi:hypothetical protein F558DRAFT_03563 [Streptomyces sp. AmelKG-A3]|nr:hypothetical protein GA0115247_132622 [Streptomyces sp. PalvLS-984]SDD19410.1 hypothetical protein F558DRAFT_03563 [Streptomyces sp. AmelKG-A3]
MFDLLEFGLLLDELDLDAGLAGLVREQRGRVREAGDVLGGDQFVRLGQVEVRVPEQRIWLGLLTGLAATALLLLRRYNTALAVTRPRHTSATA